MHRCNYFQIDILILTNSIFLIYHHYFYLSLAKNHLFLAFHLNQMYLS